MSVRLGELMVKHSLITKDQLNQALEEQRVNRSKLGNSLVKLGFIKHEELIKFLSQQYHIKAIDLSATPLDHQVVKLIPVDMAKKFLMIPVSREGSRLIVAMSDPHNIAALDDVKFITGYNIDSVLATEPSIIEAIKKYYPDKGKGASNQTSEEILNAKDYSLDEGDFEENNPFEEEDTSIVDVDDFDSLVHGAIDNVEVVEEKPEDILSVDVEAPIVKLVNGILIKAVKLGVSDIHIEPYEKAFRVRYRLDGVLQKAMGLPIKIKNAIISRIKIMSQLDIAERRLPQDGRIKMKIGKKELDFRVSVIPTLWGEKTVLRLLDKSNLQLDMRKLGFEEKQLRDFKNAIHQPFGMVLVTGPTGSGKTTTLYSALAELNKESGNIMTAENPVEFDLPGINQVQMHDEIGLNFAAALRSFLRQDPDIIMVGEIRDYETAEIAVKAALTGHMVLSTVHTNDAPSTINRLLNMGIEPFLVSSATSLILAQRLIRRICKDCKEEIELPEKTLLDLGVNKNEVEEYKLYRGKGCNICMNTGYKGRIALYEVIPVREEIKELILIGASTGEIKKEAMKLGMMTLRQSGLMRLKEGITTVEEVVRSTAVD